MTTKQILFRLNDDTATALEQKLAEKGISKQFLLNKAVELFLDDKLSFDSNMITIKSNEVAEVIKKYYLSELANLIAKDINLITLLDEKLESIAISQLVRDDSKSYQDDKSQLASCDNKSYQDDKSQLARDDNKSYQDDKSQLARDDNKSYQDDNRSDNQDSLTSIEENTDTVNSINNESTDESIIITSKPQKEAVKRDSSRARRQDKSKRNMPKKVKAIKPGTRFTGGSFSREILQLKSSSSSTVSGWIKNIKKGNLEKVPSWFVEQFDYQADHQGYDKIVKK